MDKLFSFFFFNDTATTEIYTLSLHDALPIFAAGGWFGGAADRPGRGAAHGPGVVPRGGGAAGAAAGAGVRAGRCGQVAAGLGVREVHRWAGWNGVVAPGPVPVVRGRGGVLGAGGDRAAAAGHRRGGPGRGRDREVGGGAGGVHPRRW